MLCTYEHTHNTHFGFVMLAAVLRGISSRSDSGCLAPSSPEKVRAPGPHSVGNPQQHRGRLLFLHQPRTGPHHSVAIKRGEGVEELGERQQWTNNPGGKGVFAAAKEARTRNVQQKSHGTRHTAFAFRIHRRPHTPLTQQKTKRSSMYASKC